MSDPFHNSPICEVLEQMTDEQLMMNILKNLNNNDLCNLLNILERCSEETEQRWLDAYKNLQIKW